MVMRSAGTPKYRAESFRTPSDTARMPSAQRKTSRARRRVVGLNSSTYTEVATRNSTIARSRRPDTSLASTAVSPPRNPWPTTTDRCSRRADRATLTALRIVCTRPFMDRSTTGTRQAASSARMGFGRPDSSRKMFQAWTWTR